jgi:hypothetical protein
MAFKRAATSGDYTNHKKYFWLIGELNNGVKWWGYVTPDTMATIEISSYFSDQECLDTMKPGDRISVWQVSAIDDTRQTIQLDIGAGFVDFNESFVVASDGAGINISPTAIAGSIEYSLP